MHMNRAKADMITHIRSHENPETAASFERRDTRRQCTHGAHRRPPAGCRRIRGPSRTGPFSMPGEPSRYTGHRRCRDVEEVAQDRRWYGGSSASEVIVSPPLYTGHTLDIPS